MTDADPRVPPELLDRIRADIGKVRPLLPPARRALAMLPLAFALLVLPALYWGWRGNLATFGHLWAWGLSALESAGGLALLWLAFRQSVPGRAFDGRRVALAVVCAVVLFALVTAASAAHLPTRVPPDAWLRYARECLGMALAFAIPAVALAAGLVARALPARPAKVGAVYGLAAGLMTDAGVRLFCWVTEPVHVLVAHGGAIAIATVAGALAGTWLGRRRG
jgi:hypothetical protein